MIIAKKIHHLKQEIMLRLMEEWQIEDLILDSYYQVVCVFYYADNKGERHTISEKDFHKINKVFDK